MSRAVNLVTASSFAILAAASSALAADRAAPYSSGLPAVSAVNAKVAAFGGSIEGISAWGLVGSVSVPVARGWGAQLDGMFGTGGGQAFTGAAGHIFWRNPAQGLLGVYASYVDWTTVGAQVTRFGVEGEWYSGAITFSALVTGQTGTLTGVAGKATVAYYFDPNLRVDATYHFLNGPGSSFGLGVEWLAVERSGLAFFANGKVNSNSDSSLLGGARLYIGPPKPLIRRQREDDPGTEVQNDLFIVPPPEDIESCQ